MFELKQKLMPRHSRQAAQLSAKYLSNMFLALVCLLSVAYQASGQGITKTVGVGAATGLWKPDLQMPIPETVEATISMQPTTVYKPTMELHTKGFCVPRPAWELRAAYAASCPAGTYLQNDYNGSGRQVCTATRCTGPFGANKKPASIPQAKTTTLGSLLTGAIADAPATYWGGDAGTVCNTVLLKPIMTCGEGCITDNRMYGDWCLCPNGYMACPYNGQATGYQWCQCEQLGPPYGLCVRDSYYCAYYCQYAPSWVFTAIAKSTMLCPIDPAQMDPYIPDSINPGWDTTLNAPYRRMLLTQPSTDSAADGSYRRMLLAQPTAEPDADESYRRGLLAQTSAEPAAAFAQHGVLPQVAARQALTHQSDGITNHLGTS